MPGSYDASGVEMNGAGPFPEGDYHLRITKAEAGHTKNGDPKVTVSAKVVGGEYAGRDINYHTVTFLPKSSPGAGMALTFLKCISEPYEGQFKWDESKWVGRVFKAFVNHETDPKGRVWNRIKWVNEPDPDWNNSNKQIASEMLEDVPF